jgi:NDP-sugar pyrophosphorylase family protein
MNAKVLTNLDYQELLTYHQRHGSMATISAYERQAKLDLGVIIPEGDGCIKDYGEKPTSTHLVSMGIYIFEPKVMDFIQSVEYLDFPDLVKLLLQVGHAVHYHTFSGYWLDIGMHEDHAKSAAEFASIKVF